MSTIKETFVQFLPLKDGKKNNILQNECYFSLTFMGGNYLSTGTFLQRLFGGRDEVALLASLNFPGGGTILKPSDEPNIVIDKRKIKPRANTSIPLQLDLLISIPAKMQAIGFSFKIATTKHSDNFSNTLDVLNDNKGVITALLPSVVDTALGIGKIAKEIFGKIDEMDSGNLLETSRTDFRIPTDGAQSGVDILQEGYLVILAKEDKVIERSNDKDDNEDTFDAQQDFIQGFSYKRAAPEFGFQASDKDPETIYAPAKVMYLDMEKDPLSVPGKLKYDEDKKVLLSDEIPVANTYLVFKISKDANRKPNLESDWNKKLESAFNQLVNAFPKTKATLSAIQSKVDDATLQGFILLDDDDSYLPFDKIAFKQTHSARLAVEIGKFV